ncbi:hypothetical protein CAL29_18595 [Bordetella genomosp. 10]|uniref:Medium-chain specific acyl-CoA dehydrogenase, mitochondrial n=1 Tax=Bordetella genomosp. 10 TaxID=1416804 RepID=A0A261RZX6_9BORD|nr:acyl-CoA dehydrogenase family protein [Bordetella genomosp. 10]OZI30080.1 hypothetical protein CAL29_18595 [Bordetella genomosp. 10]
MSASLPTTQRIPSSSGFYAQLDALLTERELELVRRARRFCDERLAHEPLAAFIEGRPYASSLIDDWAGEGFLSLQVPREQGGHGASYPCKIRIAQEVARHSFATAFALNNLQGSVTRLARSGSDTQRAALLEGFMRGRLLGAPALTEPEAGSDLGALRTEAARVDGGWLISGSKAWVTNGAVVNCPLVLAKVKGSGTQDGQIASFLVDMSAPSGSYARRPMPSVGGHSFRCAELVFDRHFVPDWAMFNAPGEAFKASLASITAARVHVAAMCTATLHAALCDAIAYCRQRTAFGQSLLDHQGLRWELAEVATRLEAANALAVLAAQRIESGDAAITLAAQAKKFAVDTAIWGLDQCVRCVGARGATSGMRLAMHQAELRFSAYTDGTGQLLLDRIGKGLLKDYPSTEQGK